MQGRGSSAGIGNIEEKGGIKLKYFIEKECSDGGAATLAQYKGMLDDDLEEIELLEVKRDYGGQMWCEEIGDFVEKGDCGRFCSTYKPCNGKNGRCRCLENGFIETGREFLLTKDGLKEVNN